MCTALTLRSWFPNWRQPLVDQVPVLDARLSAAAAFVRPGSTVADIGCDHGKLSAYLAAAKNCQVIAADIRPAPLARARETMLRYGCAQRVECRLGDGLSVLSAGEVQTVVIAGVSGITACDIVEACPFPLEIGTRFIFVPPTKHAHLRGWLWAHGFSLIDETPVLAAGRVYTVMCWEYTAKPETHDAFACAVGKAAKRTEAAAAYLGHVALLARKYARGVKEPDRQADILVLASRIEQEARKCSV